MNHRLATNVLIIFTAFVLLSLNVSAEVFKVGGRVVDFYGPVSGAEVKVFDAVNVNCINTTCLSSDVAPNPVETGADGKFEVFISPSYLGKTYNFTIKKRNYSIAIKQVTLSNGSLNRSLGDIQIYGIAKVKGVVMDADSERSVDNAEVVILDKSSRTDSGGNFVIDNVSAKTETIKITHEDYETQYFVYDIMPGDNFFKIKISKTYTEKDYAVSIYSNYPSLVIGAGETKRFAVYVKNIGKKDATYEIKLLDTEDNFKYRILADDENENEISKVFVSSGKIAKIYIEVKTPENVEKGEHKFKVKVGSENPAELTLICDVTESTGRYEFSASSMYRGKAVSAGSEVKFEISLENNNTDDIYKLNATAPKGWKYYITNLEGDEITEVEITKNKKLNLFFKLEPPSDEDEGVYKPMLTITSLKSKETKTLSFEVKVRQERKLYEVEVSSPFPTKSVVVGGAIEYSIILYNKGRKKDNYNLVVENLPAGWDYKFKESSGNAPQISSVAVDPGITKNIILQVNPASDADLGKYPFLIRALGNANATLNATLEIKGSHEMRLKIDDLWVTTDAGVKKEIPINVQNVGLSELRDVELDVIKPQGWTVTVTPTKVPSLKPQMTAKFIMGIEPPADAGVNDYKIIVKAKSQEVETSEDSIRVTVSKPSSSGLMGFILIVAAIAILIIIFKMFGRR